MDLEAVVVGIEGCALPVILLLLRAWCTARPEILLGVSITGAVAGREGVEGQLYYRILNRRMSSNRLPSHI